ncbi:MAG: hypothetical protein IAE82_06035 [Opitutaceae bacterium]|nr:hypothetical protein [Opitutaceae bacterium]
MPDRSTIVQELRRAGLIATGEQVDIAELRRNPQRADAPFTDTYRVTRAGQPWCHLTVGTGLLDRWQRASAFASACPGIACAPLFHHECGHAAMLGVAWFEGASLEDRCRDGSLPFAGARAILDRLHAALAATREPSTPEAAAREFEAFAHGVLQAAVFSAIDRVLLREIVLPFIRTHALRGAMETRLTNGDFIARNVLVADGGDARLIDCEFSHRTHFYATDLWRWREFSALPGELLESTAEGTGPRLQPWVEMYSILQHLVLAEQSQGLAVAVAEARVRLPRLFEVISVSHPALRASLLWPLLTSAAPPQPAGPENGWVSAQLFWSAHGAFTEAQSRRLAYVSGRTSRLTFLVPEVAGPMQFRLDPSETPGLVTVSTLRVDRLVDGQRQPLLPSGQDWSRVQVFRGAMRLRAVAALNILVLDIDPSLGLPSVSVSGPAADVLVEIEIRHDSNLDAVPGLLALGHP